MIQSVKITNNKNLPLRYVSDIESLANGTEYKFKNGINIIIGQNGCGKSTLMKLMAMYLLCEKSMCSKCPYDLIQIGDLFHSSLEEKEYMKDGIDIKSDYLSVTYNYFVAKEMDNDCILGSVHSISAYMDSTSSSTGEGMTSMLYRLFNYAFNNEKVKFPIEEVLKKMEVSNDYWANNLKQLLAYYERNRIKIEKKDFAYTFLLDEPDRNLDVTRIGELYNVLSYQKEYTQIICVIHNPILIYKLSKLDYINFIEMSPNYLNEVKKVFDDL